MSSLWAKTSFFLALSGIVVGCAVGTGPEDDLYDDGIGDEDPTDAGADVRDGGAGGNGGSTADAADGSGGGGEDDGGVDGDSGADDDGGDAEPSDPCAAMNTCSDPTHVGRVRGDDGGDTIVVHGTTPQWFRVQVDEVDSSFLIGRKLKLRATLSSPAGKNFDLYGYRKASCGSPSAQSNNYSTDDVINLEWGEGAIPNGDDDSEAIHLEVRWVSGVCAEDAPYTLTIRGNP